MTPETPDGNRAAQTRLSRREALATFVARAKQ